MDGALLGPTGSGAKEPDHQRGGKFGEGHRTGSLKDEESNLKVLCSLKFCEAVAKGSSVVGKLPSFREDPKDRCDRPRRSLLYCPSPAAARTPHTQNW